MFLGLMLCLPLHAVGGSLHGIVTAGPNKTPIANAHVVIKGEGQEQGVLSNADGHYEFLTLNRSRSYVMVVEADGLRTLTQNEILIADEESRQIDVNLEMADVRSTVVVTQGVINLEAASAEVN